MRASFFLFPSVIMVTSHPWSQAFHQVMYDHFSNHWHGYLYEILIDKPPCIT